MCSSDLATGARAQPEPAPTGDRARGAFLRGLAVDSRLAPGGSVAGAALARSLAGIARTGADAMSFTSFAYVRPSEPSFPGGRLPLGLESVEGGEGLALGVAAARAAGMRAIMLQPHVLAEEGSGHWAWRHRTLSKDWDEFFAGFEPWLLHYAHLAELLEIGRAHV